MIRALVMALGFGHASHAAQAAACRLRMPPLALRIRSYSTPQINRRYRMPPCGEVRIAQIDIGMLRLEHELEQRMARLCPSFFRCSNFKCEYPMWDIVAVAHGNELPREQVFEHQCFILAVQRRPRGDNHPIHIRFPAVEKKRFE